jgi:hypothetical protein
MKRSRGLLAIPAALLVLVTACSGLLGEEDLPVLVDSGTDSTATSDGSGSSSGTGSGSSSGGSSGSSGTTAGVMSGDAGPTPDADSGSGSTDGMSADSGTDACICDEGACYQGVCGGSNIVQVAPGYHHACALLKSGSVWCWGSDIYGAVGGDPAGDSTCGSGDGVKAGPCQPTAREVTGLPGIAQISAGQDVTCAVDGTGGVWCWGNNVNGALGHSPSLDMTNDAGVPYNNVPVRVSGISAAEIGAGTATCARTSAGQVWCWGAVNTYVNSGLPVGPTPVQVAGLPTIASLAQQSDANGTLCALGADRTIWCWGDNAHGERLGASPGAPAAQIAGTAGTLGNIETAVVSADDSICVLMEGNGGVWCWGQNAYGGFGNGTLGTFGGSFHTPAQTQAGPFLQRTDSCALSSAGAVSCWAANYDGMVGDGTGATTTAGLPTGTSCINAAICAPSPISVPKVAATQIVRVATTSLAVVGGTTVWAWGGNPDGRLGHKPGTLGDAFCGYETCNPLPNQVQGLP